MTHDLDIFMSGTHLGLNGLSKGLYHPIVTLLFLSWVGNIFLFLKKYILLTKAAFI